MAEAPSSPSTVSRRIPGFRRGLKAWRPAGLAQNWQIERGCGMFVILPIAPEHIDGFHRALDIVARERKYLSFLEAPPLAGMRDFVRGNIAARNPQFVALREAEVVGWCDICRNARAPHAHVGALGMAVLPPFRGQGLGRRLIEATLDAARREGFARVELHVFARNLRAVAPYEKLGFQREGLLRDFVCIDGRFDDALMMALIFEEDRKRLPANAL